MFSPFIYSIFPASGSPNPEISFIASMTWREAIRAGVAPKTGTEDPLIKELVKEAFSRHIVIVAAAGDKGLTNYPPYPAALHEVIAVAAVDIQHKPYTEGITGDFIDICAPGVDIITTAPGDKYNFYTGTSMAAALVTGAVALLLQRHPDLKPDQVRSLFEGSARDLGALGRDKQCGCGLVDLERLLEEAKKK